MSIAAHSAGDSRGPRRQFVEPQRLQRSSSLKSDQLDLVGQAAGLEIQDRGAVLHEEVAQLVQALCIHLEFLPRLACLP